MRCDLNYIFNNYPDRCIAGFNVYGYEDAAAVIEAAEEIQCPVILMVNVPAAEHMPIRIIGALLAEMADEANVPVCVHLDHSTSMENIALACSSGFTSVMFDGSQLPYEENVEMTKRARAIAHASGLSIEAEIGSVGYSDPSIKAKTVYTRPEEAASFYAETRVDALAVSVGTTHRQTVQNAELRLDLLDSIRTEVSVPLVIHGSSSVKDAELPVLALHGAKKINLGTCLRMSFGKALHEAADNMPTQFDRIELFKPCMAAVRQEAEKKLRLLNVRIG